MRTCLDYVWVRLGIVVGHGSVSYLSFHDGVVIGNSKLLSVILPTSLVAISDYAFEYCSALLTVTIPT
jgi:hypothetical protein